MKKDFKKVALIKQAWRKLHRSEYPNFGVTKFPTLSAIGVRYGVSKGVGRRLQPACPAGRHP
jgi:hypothetical protein